MLGQLSTNTRNELLPILDRQADYTTSDIIHQLHLRYSNNNPTGIQLQTNSTNVTGSGNKKNTAGHGGSTHNANVATDAPTTRGPTHGERKWRKKGKRSNGGVEVKNQQMKKMKQNHQMVLQINMLTLHSMILVNH